MALTVKEIAERHHKDWQYRAPEYIDRLLERIRELEQAIENIPWHEYGDAFREGCDANGAWDCFNEAVDKHFAKVMK